MLTACAKCRDVGFARRLFEEMTGRDAVAWNALISGYAQVGESREALELFHLMQLEGVKVNGVCMISVLSACTQLGALHQGRWAHSYIERNKIKITVTLGTTLVDMYAKCGDMEKARAGRLEDAVRIINQMPMIPHAAVWSSLLHGSRMYKNLELGVLASQKMLELETGSHGAYVLLSNIYIYADSDDWDNVSYVRQSMKSRGVRKQPGCSVMEVNGEVHEFFVGDKSHPRYPEIEEVWKEISRRLRLAGYKADTSPVMFDIDEEEKEDALCLHSEKVAIAFGIMSLKEDVPIRIMKNLRVCGDCHEVFMMIAKIFDRETIVRDRNRFHHFKDGLCSCNGFW